MGKKSPNEIIGRLNTNQFFETWNRNIIPQQASDTTLPKYAKENLSADPEKVARGAIAPIHIDKRIFKDPSEECKDLDSYCHRWKKLAGEFKM